MPRATGNIIRGKSFDDLTHVDKFDRSIIEIVESSHVIEIEI